MNECFYPRNSGRYCVFLLAVILFLSYFGFSSGADTLVFLGFKKAEKDVRTPEGWELVKYMGTAENEVALSVEDKRTVLHMRSLNSSSGFLKRFNIDNNTIITLSDYPVLVWCWKVSRTIGMAMEHRKDRNDCAARIRVIFGVGQKPLERNPEIEKVAKYLGLTIPSVEPPGYKIDYVWANRMLKGDIIDYPGEKTHKMLAVESGNDKACRWIWEERNLMEDFRKCFNEEPPGIAGIVVLSDTDQTNEGVESWYSSIVLTRDQSSEEE